MLGLTVNRLKLAHIFYLQLSIAKAAGVGESSAVMGQMRHRVLWILEEVRKDKAWA